MVGMLPKVIEPELILALLGVGGLEHGGTYRHMPNGGQIACCQNGFKVAWIQELTSLGGPKPEDADTKGRIQLDNLSQLPGR